MRRSIGAVTVPSASRSRSSAPAGTHWVDLVAEPIDVTAIEAWATGPTIGAVVTFRGTVRDHAPGRAGVHQLTYEAYEPEAISRLERVVAAVGDAVPAAERLAVVHRVGDLAVTDVAVAAVAASAHRPAAFEAARLLIDATKEAVPIWKHERWADGEDWGTCAHAIGEPEEVVSRLVAEVRR